MPIAKNRDDLLQPLLRNRAPHERFLITAMFRLLQECKPGVLEEVLSDHAPRDINWQKIIVGKAAMHWNGKSREQIAKEVGPKGVDEVVKGLAEIGIDVPASPVALPAPAVSTRKRAVVRQEEAAVEHEGEAPDEPTFAGRSLSSLDGLTDADLLKIEGFSKATIKQVRDAQELAKAAGVNQG